VTGVPSGYKDLDKLTAGFQKSDLIIIAARPSMGKTALGLCIARNAAKESGVPVGFFSLEMSKEQLAMRLLCSEARVDSHKIRSGFLSRQECGKLLQAAGLFMDVPIYIDDTPGISPLELRAKARRIMADQGLGLVVIDYLQLMRGRETVERREQEISEISRSLKGLAKELDIPVIAIAQLNRKVEERADKRPLLSDLRESGAIEQDADVIAFIYRDELYAKQACKEPGVAEIIIGKQRNGPSGETVKLAYISTYTRFENLAISS
jgi:replicative DNA helicase